MLYIGNNFSKLAKPLRFGDLKLRDLAKLFFKIITKSNLKPSYDVISVTSCYYVTNLTSQNFPISGPPNKISGYVSVRY